MKMLARQRVTAWLLERKRTQRWLAAKLGCTPTYVTLLLSGQRTPSLAMAKRIQQITGIPATDFVDLHAA